MAPAQGWHAQIEKCKQFFLHQNNNLRDSRNNKWCRQTVNTLLASGEHAYYWWWGTRLILIIVPIRRHWRGRQWRRSSYTESWNRRTRRNEEFTCWNTAWDLRFNTFSQHGRFCLPNVILPYCLHMFFVFGRKSWKHVSWPRSLVHVVSLASDCNLLPLSAIIYYCSELVLFSLLRLALCCHPFFL